MKKIEYFFAKCQTAKYIDISYQCNHSLKGAHIKGAALPWSDLTLLIFWLKIFIFYNPL